MITEKIETPEIRFVNGKPEGYLTVKELAKKLFVTPNTIYVWMRRGKLEPIYICGAMYFPEDTKLPDEKPRGRRIHENGRYKSEQELRTMDIVRFRMKQRMIELGLTNVDLSVLIDCDERTISRYLNGRDGMSLGRFIAIAKALDVSTDWLCGIKNEEAC